MQEQNCKTCRRMYHGRCEAFKHKPKECWAWTDDKDWRNKVKADIDNYRHRYQGVIGG